MIQDSLPRPVVVLMGPPTSGKTSAGKIVASRLGLPFRDTDSDIEHRIGKSVRDIFIQDGETRFREWEEEAVAAALADYAGVLALGGGAVMSPRTQERLAGHRVVFLSVTAATAARRVGVTQSRPWLGAHMPMHAHLRALLDERLPVYQKLAWRTVATDDRTPRQTADDVMALLPDIPRIAERA